MTVYAKNALACLAAVLAVGLLICVVVPDVMDDVPEWQVASTEVMKRPHWSHREIPEVPSDIRQAIQEATIRFWPNSEAFQAAGITLHFLRLFDASDQPPSGFAFDTIKSTIFDTTKASEVYGGDLSIVKTRYGIRFVTSRFPRAAVQTHPGQALATFAELGVPLSQEIHTATGDYPLEQMLNDTIAVFDATEELEWVGVSLVTYLSPNRTWSNGDAETFSFDELVAALLCKNPGTAACGGTHLLYCLAVIFAVDREHRVLSDSSRTILKEILFESARQVEAMQSSTGEIRMTCCRIPFSLGIPWARRQHPRIYEMTIAPTRDPAVYAVLDEMTSQSDLSNVTYLSHHMEWLALVPESWRPDDNWWISGYRYLLEEIEKLSDAELVEYYCPYSHAARILRQASRL